MVPTYKNRKYEIIAYDPTWTSKFSVEAKKLRLIFKDNTISIEHVGSTSVPRLAGKPTIDILIALEDISIIENFEKRIKDIGYHPLGRYVTDSSYLFVKETNGTREYNVHIFQKNDPHVKEMLQLREYLKTHENIAEEYSQLKFNLKEKYPENYGQYRKLKDLWMNNILKKVEIFFTK